MHFVIKNKDWYYAGLDPMGRVRNASTLSGAAILKEEEILGALERLHGGTIMGIQLFKEPSLDRVEEMQKQLPKYTFAEVRAYLRVSPFDPSVMSARAWLEVNRDRMNPAIKDIQHRLWMQASYAPDEQIIKALLSDGVGDTAYYNGLVINVTEQLRDK